MIEINKPITKQHWLVTDGILVLHTGVVEINQVITTGLSILEQAPTELALIAKLNAHVNKLSSLPSSGNVNEGNYHKFENRPVFVKKTHDRATSNPNNDINDNFIQEEV